MKVRFYLVLLLLMFLDLTTFALLCQTNPETKDYFIHSSSREIIPLNGVWQASFDEVDWFTTNLPKVFYNCEKIILRKVIKVAQKFQGDYYWHLHFFGISDEVEVFWNGQILGRFISENTPIVVSIPKKFGIHTENELKLIVYSSHPLARLAKQNYPFSRKIVTGISREFFLVRTPPIWINSINSTVKWLEGPKAELNLQVQVNSFAIEGILAPQNGGQLPSKGLFTCEIQLLDKQDKQTAIARNIINFEISSFRNIKLNISLPITNFKFWDIDEPNLYEIVAKISRSDIVYDDLSRELGFRSVEYKKTSLGNSFIVNGKPFLFKGVDLVEDFDYYNSGGSIKKIEQDVIMLKSLGVNTVRFFQTPPNPAFLSFCNKYGLFVLIDLPLYNVPKELLQKNDFFVRYQTIGENIAKVYSTQPSFLGLGFGEGLQEGSEEIENFYHGLRKKIKGLGDFLNYKTIFLHSYNYSYDDFDFIIIKDNWRYYSVGELSSKIREHISYCRIPIALNFGTIINPNNRNGYNDKLSIEYQAHYILQRYNLSEKYQLAGNFIWTFNDYFLENPLVQVANVEPYVCYSGLVNNIRQPRLAFFVLRALYNNEDPPIINPGLVEITFPFTYIFVGLIVAMIVGAMLYRSRRFREYFYRSLFHSYNFFADIRDRRIISNVQTFMLLVSLSLIIGGYISSFLDYYKNIEIFRYAVLLLLPNTFLREWLFRIVLSLELSTLAFSILFCLKLFLIMILLRFFAILFQRKVFLDDTFKMVVWACLPILMLLPLTIFVSRIFPISLYLSYFFNIVFILIILWAFMRIVRSVWIVFDIPKRRVYFGTFIFIFLILFFVLTYFEYKYYIIEYSNLFVQQFF